MESVVTPLLWSDYKGLRRDAIRAYRSPEGEELILHHNFFVERNLPRGVIRPLAEAELTEYRRPFINPGEDRRPTLTWPRQIPIDGEPVDVVKVVSEYADWLAHSQVPKLFINGDPGSLSTGRPREFCRTWPNQTEITVKGIHHLQEDSPAEIDAALADFVRRLRTTSP
jgi:haloalkane dehalogenase